MARYKHIDTSPRFLAVELQRQLMPGSFEHALNHLLDHEMDLSGLDARYRSDETGASAYPPAMLLKVILFASLSPRQEEGASLRAAPPTQISCAQRFPPLLSSLSPFFLPQINYSSGIIGYFHPLIP